MANFTIKGNKHSVVEFKQSDSTWTVVASATLSVTNNSAIFEDFDKSGNTLINKGHVFADNGQHTVTIFLNGEGTDVTNTKTGVITGLTGVRLGGDHQTMLNQGIISTSDEGVTVYGTKSHLTNDGRITADDIGIDLINCDNSVIDNAAGGKIKSGGTGVSFSTDTDVAVTFTNEGSVKSAFAAVSGSNGDDKVINHGTLIGDVYLGDGDNVFDTRGGTLDGLFIAGDGDDTLITDKASVKFSNTSDTDGVDTVKSTVSYKLNANVENLYLLGTADINGTGTGEDNTISGNSGDNVIKGMGGFDTLSGGKGNDRLSGGSDIDVFQFSTGDGKDVLTNFNVDSGGGASTDVLDISKWNAISDFDDLMAHHIKNVGGDAMIFAGADSILLTDVHKADLSNTDFVF